MCVRQQTCMYSYCNTHLSSEDAILDGELVWREGLRGPLADLHAIGQYGLQSVWLAEGDLLGHHVLLPVLQDHPVAEVPREGTSVAEEGGREETVPEKTHPLLL